MALAHIAPTTLDLRCPNCGAAESDGGCKDPKMCGEALARVEEDFAKEITILLNQNSDNRPLHLLMAGFEALELLHVGLALTNASAHVLMANRTAERILAARDGLELTARGILRTVRDSDPSLLDLIVTVADGARTGETRHAMLAIQRPSSKRPLTLLVRPARGSTVQPDFGGPAALVFILDPELPVQAAEEELRQLYGLTSTETRLANLLMEGKTLEECCVELRVRRPTVCSHLQHLFRKTGVQRQSELVSVLFKSIGLIRTGALGYSIPSAGASLTLEDACARILRTRLPGV